MTKHKDSYRRQLARLEQETHKRLQDMFVLLTLLNERLEIQEKALLSLGVAPGSLESGNPKGADKLTSLTAPFAPNPNTPLFTEVYGDAFPTAHPYKAPSDEEALNE